MPGVTHQLLQSSLVSSRIRQKMKSCSGWRRWSAWRGHNDVPAHYDKLFSIAPDLMSRTGLGEFCRRPVRHKACLMTCVAREDPIEQRRSDVADVRDARGAGCIARADLHMSRIVAATALTSVMAVASLRAMLPACLLLEGSITRHSLIS